MNAPRSSPAPRTPEPGEFVPADYFRTLARAELFNDDAPLEIDLGCGDGTFLLEMARAHPERRFLGTERLLGRVRGTCRRLTQAGLTNAKVLRLESRYTVEWLLPAESVARLHLLYPDPWPKLRHQRRRLIQGEFLAAVWRVLVPGGEFLFKTDDEAYHAWAEEQVAVCGRFTQCEWPDEEFFYPPTDFEQLWQAQGKSLFRSRYVKAGGVMG